MNPTICIAIIISAIALVGMVVIAVNYSLTPAHAKQCWLRPGSGGSPCFDNRHDCEQPIKDLGLTCHRKTQ
ncbi:MAG: hypothetical protein ACJ71P_14810 [Nitrososphaeraceae archaeon]|jgi:hypothetical protein